MHIIVHASLFHAQHSFLHFRHRFPENNNKIYTVRFLFLMSVYRALNNNLNIRFKFIDYAPVSLISCIRTKLPQTFLVT
jgi:hypothetical protein